LSPAFVDIWNSLQSLRFSPGWEDNKHDWCLVELHIRAWVSYFSLFIPMFIFAY
jgi:hypothetical protein